MGVFSKEAPDGTVRRSAWHSSLWPQRKEILKMMGLTLLLVTGSIWLVFSLYLGSYYRQTQNAYRLTVRIIDLDSQYASQVAGAPAAILGPAVRQAALENAAASPDFHLGWQIAGQDELSRLKLTSGGQGMNGSDYAYNIVYEQDVFAAIVINPNATVLATEAAQRGLTTYDPRGAITFYYQEARNFYTQNQYVSLLSVRLINSAIAQASTQFAQQILRNAAPATNGGAANATALISAVSGNALSYPFYYNEHNIVPFDQLAAEAATTAGQIYLIIFTFFASPLWKKAYENLRPKISIPAMLCLHWIVPVASYFWISLNYSLVTLAFHTDFTRKYGRAGFPAFWANNWTSMTALGLVMETMLRILGQLYFPFFLVLWVIFNVSTVFLDLSDMDRFYLYGFVSPVWNSVDTSKSIIYGTKNHMTQNFAVNLAWIFFGSIALLLVCARQRKKEDKEAIEKKAKEVREKEEKQNGRELTRDSSETLGNNDNEQPA